MKRGQRSPGMYAWPKPKSSPLPEYSIELRFVAPMASATAAIPVLCCVQPRIDIVIAMPAIIPLSIFQPPLRKGSRSKRAVCWCGVPQWRHTLSKLLIRKHQALPRFMLGHLLGLGFVLVRDVELDRARRKFGEILVPVNGAARSVDKLAGL